MLSAGLSYNTGRLPQWPPLTQARGKTLWQGQRRAEREDWTAWMLDQKSGGLGISFYLSLKRMKL